MHAVSSILKDGGDMRSVLAVDDNNRDLIPKQERGRNAIKQDRTEQGEGRESETRGEVSKKDQEQDQEQATMTRENGR